MSLNSAMHKGKPLRSVVFIETQVGKLGGETWKLTLECGHYAFRPVPKIHDHGSDFARGGAYLQRILGGAPKRCRCLHCEAAS